MLVKVWISIFPFSLEREKIVERVTNESAVLVKVHLLIFATKRMPPLFPTGILFFIISNHLLF